jgi:hypothetical protein
MAVPFQQCADLRAGAFVGTWRELLELGEIRRSLTGECFHDHAFGLLADPGQVA